MERINTTGILLVWTSLVCIPLVDCTEGLALSVGIASNISGQDVICRENLEYLHAGICCLYCPAGTYVKKACSRTSERGVCEQCGFEYYTEHDSGLEKCLSCTTCRSDQEVVEQCSSTRNTRCRCKPGHYCIPDHVCEVCRTCRRCQEDEVVVKSCTPISNTVCQKKGSQTTAIATSIVVSVVVLFGLLVLVSCLYWKISTKGKQTVSSGWSRRLMKNGRRSDEVRQDGMNVASDDSPLVQPFVIQIPGQLVGVQGPAISVDPKVEEEEEEEEEDRGLGESLPNTTTSSQNSLSMCAEHWSRRLASASVASGHSPSWSHPTRCSLLPCLATLQVLNSLASEKKKRLIPINGDESLKKSFDLFEDVDVHYLNRFFRNIGLSDNAIKNAETLSPEDKVYELLKIWMEKEGMKADFNTLIDVLISLDQRLSAENIVVRAVGNGYFKYEDD